MGRRRNIVFAIIIGITLLSFYTTGKAFRVALPGSRGESHSTSTVVGQASRQDREVPGGEDRSTFPGITSRDGAATKDDAAGNESPIASRSIFRLAREVPDYGGLKAEIMEYLNTRPATYGIYFKDLKSGVSFGINEREPITAASTIKVPVVLYLNYLVAEGKASWSDRVTYNSATDYQDGAGILQFSARDGDKYSLRVLANLAITISDNVANRMLMRHLGKENIAEFMRSLGGEMVFPDGANITTAHDMGMYMEAVLEFRDAHPALGSRLLDDMANPIYHVGLPGELPDRVMVAHKEGDVWGVANDVGIVFAKRPYVLVVLSKGVNNIDEGFHDIARISRMVYEYQTKVTRALGS